MKSPASKSTSLPFSISKIAIAQICQSIGFHGAQSLALESLLEISTLYLQTLARHASSLANSSNRTQSNLLDVISALEILASVRGFPGASHGGKPLLRSGALREIVNFVESFEELPFARRIPYSLCERASPPLPPLTFAELEQDPPSSHIPSWLPAFPYSVPCADAEARVSVDGVEGIGGGREEDGEFRTAVTSIEKVVRALPVERPRVRFRLGSGSGSGLGFERMGTRNGVCRGGKRVCWRGNAEEARLDGEGCVAERVGGEGLQFRCGAHLMSALD